MEPNEISDKEKIANKASFKEIVDSAWQYIKNLVSLSDDTDSVATINNISKGVEFRGDNVWVLFFAIVIASVGLNVNSTAVIIGAMLVSPLMGPIMGLGLSIGINDMILLRKSLKNLFTMVMISLVASSTYFLLTPLSDAQSELLARTTPTIFDVFIAFFGGLAGILASSRKQEKVTVVSGVAIATALMPPLCTAGYGIGTGQFIYFFGAFYLFFINSFFIALATFLMVRYLKFPQKTYIDPIREKRVKHTIIFFSILVIVPSVFIALSVVKETSFNSMAIKYIADVGNSKIMDDVQIVNNTREYSRKGSKIIISVVGKPITPDQIELLQERLEDYNLTKTKLVIKQAAAGILDIDAQAEMLQEFIEKKDLLIAQKDSIIFELEKYIELEKNRSKITPSQIASEVNVLFPYVAEMTMSEAVKVNTKSGVSDTIPTINVRWAVKPSETDVVNLKSWLKVRLNENNVDIVNI